MLQRQRHVVVCEAADCLWYLFSAAQQTLHLIKACCGLSAVLQSILQGELNVHLRAIVEGFALLTCKLLIVV
jgi:hypothetical protein